ncbi:hypothetical protein [Microbispora sp. GKU 823]|uniref:hypothetical protein n=1 Tax=Microbispora sp. GKU 823 TaxID=1652100 RepID=UPI0009A3F034|nr:hypothetical protein [Microbispora sp. GKU 823]OPG11887.1 hypothetical protein B1L11_17750 [Microbispora sp. GKU 823]
MNPEEAARSLATIRQTQAKALSAEPWFPTWYGVGVGLFVTGMQFVTEPGTPVPVTVAVGLLLFAGLGALVAVLVRTRRIKAHRSLTRPKMIAALMAWIGTAIALCLALAFAIDAAGVAYARTYAALVMTAYLLVTGPLAGRLLTGMLVRRAVGGS